MFVDKDNFEEQFKNIKEIASKELYAISLDLEFTGLRLLGNDPEYKEDCLAERFAKMKKVAKVYNIIQVGLTFFNKTAETQLTAHPYNIENPIFVPQVSMEASSIEFCCVHGMDWTRWIAKGVTYLSQQTKEKFLNQIEREQQQKDNEDSDYTLISAKFSEEEQETFMKEKENIKQWTEDQNNQSIYKILGQNSYFRRFYHKYMQQEHPDVMIETQEGEMIMKKVGIEQKQIIEKKNKEDLINQHLGFLRVLELIWKRDVPIIGHNCLYDFMYMYDAFIGFLPEYDQFKKDMHQYFPIVFDTKFLFQKLFPRDLSSTTLEKIKDHILQNPAKFSNVDIVLNQDSKHYDFQNADNQQNYHEAGFDSYLTGWIFSKIMFNKNEVELRNLRNFINLFNSYFIMSLEGADIRTDRNCIFVAKAKEFASKQKYLTTDEQQQRKEGFINDSKEVKEIFRADYYKNELIGQEEQKEDQKDKKIPQYDTFVSVIQGTGIILIELQESAIEKKQQQLIKDASDLKLRKYPYDVVSFQEYISQKTIDFLQMQEQRNQKKPYYNKSQNNNYNNQGNRRGEERKYDDSSHQPNNRNSYNRNQNQGTYVPKQRQNKY